MNLLEHTVKKIIEPIKERPDGNYEIVLLVNCYGIESIKTKVGCCKKCLKHYKVGYKWEE